MVVVQIFCSETWKLLVVVARTCSDSLFTCSEIEFLQPKRALYLQVKIHTQNDCSVIGVVSMLIRY